MDSVVLLSVLAITCTTVVARPSDMHFKTKRSAEEDSGEVFNPPALKFPTEIIDGFIVTINGTIDTTSNSLEAVFPSVSEDEKDDCKLIFDFEKKKIFVTPVPPGARNTSDYEIIGDWDQPGVHPTFSIRLTARAIKEKNMFKLTFEANSGGPSDVVICPIAKFDDYSGIEFKKGVHSITSVLFQFK